MLELCCTVGRWRRERYAIRKVARDFCEYHATAAMRGAAQRVRKTTRDRAFPAHLMVFSQRERQLPLSAHSQNTKEQAGTPTHARRTYREGVLRTDGDLHDRRGR